MDTTPGHPVTKPKMYCRQCRYPLDHLDKYRCPECGRAFDPKDPRTYQTKPPHHWMSTIVPSRFWGDRKKYRIAIGVYLCLIALACFFPPVTPIAPAPRPIFSLMRVSVVQLECQAICHEEEPDWCKSGCNLAVKVKFGQLLLEIVAVTLLGYCGVRIYESYSRRRWGLR